MARAEPEDIPRDAVPLAAKVAFLRSPAAYPGATAAVSAIETHMSWVFLAGERVYKLKKPVRYPHLDFSTLAARERDCREEVRLNRRLAGAVYRGVVALGRRADGTLALGAGTPVDWLVEMRRLPAARMLDQLLAHGGVSRAAIVAVAERLAAFYREGAPVALAPSIYLERFAAEHARNVEVLRDPRFAAERALVDAALARVERGLDGDRAALEVRASERHIVEGHGDLRPEHVCLVEPPVIIDCLEFSAALRSVDPFDEVSFLGLECARLGAGWIFDVVHDVVAARLGDHPPRAVLDFYRAYRGCLRARLALVHVLEGEQRRHDGWLPQARAYLRLTAPRPAR